MSPTTSAGTTAPFTSVATPADLRARLDSVPRVSLAIATAPLHAVPRLAADIGGPSLWFMRDDLLGFGGGGNKVRGLEYLLAAAEGAGADTLVTGAGPQSNHVRATAATAAVAGLAMHAVCWGDEPATVSGNLRLTLGFGASMHYTGDPDRASVDRCMASVATTVRDAGGQPYVIPRGGADALGVLGHVRAALELVDRAASGGPRPGLVVLAVGSGATLAGWLLAARLFGVPWQVVGYTVSRPVAEARARVLALATDAAALLGISPAAASVEDFVDIRDGAIGDGYGVPSAQGQAALERVARREGILLDPTYTGKAFGGYLADMAAGHFDAVACAVFIHTGGEPANFAVRDG